MRSLGRFFGHIGSAITQPAPADPPAGPTAERREVGRTTDERQAVDADGRQVVLRRTTIDEIEIREDRP